MLQKKFLFSKKNYLRQASHYAERTQKRYVYVLYTNQGKQNEPYYVGLTESFEQSFNLSEEIQWHHKIYGKLPIVHVVASHPNHIAEESKNNLIELLNRNGFTLHNLPKYYGLNESSMPFDQLVKLWINKWDKQVHNISKDITAFNKSDLQQVILNRKYASKDAKSLSLRLAKDYNVQTNIAEFYFSSLDKQKIESLRYAIKHLNGDWYLKEDFKTNATLLFYMSDALKAAVLSNVKTKIK